MCRACSTRLHRLQAIRSRNRVAVRNSSFPCRDDGAFEETPPMNGRERHDLLHPEIVGENERMDLGSLVGQNPLAPPTC